MMLTLVLLQVVQVACAVTALVLFIQALQLWRSGLLKRAQDGAALGAALQQVRQPGTPAAALQPHLPVVLSLCDPFGNEEHEINMMAPVGQPPPTTHEYADRQWRYHDTTPKGVHCYRRPA